MVMNKNRMLMALSGLAAISFAINAGMILERTTHHIEYIEVPVSASQNTGTSGSQSSFQAPTQQSQPVQSSSVSGPIPSKLAAIVSSAQAVPSNLVSAFEHIKATDDKGNVQYLNAMQQPIMFAAYWCPHCQNTLSAFQRDGIAIKPVILSCQSTEQGTLVPLAQTVSLTKSEFSTLNFNPQSYQVSYESDLSTVTKLDAAGYPEVVFKYDGKLYTVTGEQADPTVWGKLFSSAQKQNILGS